MSRHEGKFENQKEKQKSLVELSKFLQNNKVLKSRIGLLENKDQVEFFRYKRLERALLSMEYKKKQMSNQNQLPVINNSKDVQDYFILFVQNLFFIPVKKLHTFDVKKEPGWKPVKGTPTLQKIKTASVDANAYYAWIYRNPNPYIMFYGLGFMILILCLILFPLWPTVMKKGVWKLSIVVMVLVSLFFVIALLRLITYLITLFVMGKTLWIFPNLFADCGVIESFKPLYSFVSKKKKSKSKKKNKLDPQTTTSLSQQNKKTTGASINRTDVKKRAISPDKGQN